MADIRDNLQIVLVRKNVENLCKLHQQQGEKSFTGEVLEPPHPSSYINAGRELVAAPLPLTECFDLSAGGRGR